MRRILAAALLAAGALATPALAQAPATGTTTVAPGVGPITGLAAGQITAKRLMDRDVYGSDGSRLGEIEDLIIDPASGRIVGIVIEYDGRLGFGDREVALPLDRLTMDGDRRVTVGMTREQMRDLPRFEGRR